jgi:predicted SAM-dependent methyltransferase
MTTIAIKDIKRYLRRQPVLFSIFRAIYYGAFGCWGLFVSAIRNPRMFKVYCRDNAVRKLHLGCENIFLRGWFNTDRYPRHSWVAYCNAMGNFPFPDDSFDRVFSEHMIEHIDFQSGLKMLSECHRILKRGGRIRIATPDLEKIFALKTPVTELERSYMEYQISEIEEAIDVQPSFVINRMMRAWGHTFIYDQATLTSALAKVGFRDIAPCEPCRSSDPNFDGIDQHGNALPLAEFNLVETMVLEATK